MVDKVKTFNVGLVNGFSSAFVRLDELVNELGEIEIKYLEDKYFCRQGITDPAKVSPEYSDCITRTVVYRIL